VKCKFRKKLQICQAQNEL